MAPPRLWASSASRTKSASRSGSAYTATLPMPASLQARITRTAISPRFAIRTFCNGFTSGKAQLLVRGLFGFGLRRAHYRPADDQASANSATVA